MQAIQMIATGSVDVLQIAEIAEPVPAAGQVKVQIRAAGVNPVDAKLRNRGMLFPDALPAIPGCDGAGIVTACGSGVTIFKPGDAVWYCNGGLGREPGNYAEFALVDEKIARRKPAAMSFNEAAAAPLVLITAWEALFDRGKLQPGHTVLIHAGAGGVGHVAVQLARHAGATVIATVGNPENENFVRQLGADEIINYKQKDFVAEVLRLTGDKGADVVFDCVGGETFRRSIPVVACYGKLITLLDPGNDVAWKEARERNLSIGFVLMLTPMIKDLPQARMHQGKILDQCAQLIETGKLRIHVSRVFALRDAAQAHRLVETG
ncbi:MAG: NADPH:quinone reductase, partial [Pseudomonadota bacterium]|nr:NADPH:quinone reductase [Pseudomonadota bacterium]